MTGIFVFLVCRDEQGRFLQLEAEHGHDHYNHRTLKLRWKEALQAREVFLKGNVDSVSVY